MGGRVGDGCDVVGQVVEAGLAVAQGVEEDVGVLVDDGLLPVLFLDVHGAGHDADDGHQGEADDGKADGDFDHGEGGGEGRRKNAA